MSTYIVAATCTIEAAHQATWGEGSNDIRRRIHGHSYQIEAHVRSGQLNDVGTVCDLDRLRADLAGRCAPLDHALLNDVPGLPAPTMEAIAQFVGDGLAALGYAVAEVRVIRPTLGFTCRYVPRGPASADPGEVA